MFGIKHLHCSETINENQKFDPKYDYTKKITHTNSITGDNNF